jgi:DNA-binding CsgD family transcriptional regulator
VVSKSVTLEHLQKELMVLLSETLRINDNMLNHWYRSQNRMLSPTERAILRYMSCGYSIPEIAAQLERNIKTIRAHKFNAMVKLGVNSDVGLLDAADIITHLPAREPQVWLSHADIFITCLLRARSLAHQSDADIHPFCGSQLCHSVR